MGLSDTPYVGFDAEIVSLLSEMYEAMGNQIAMQYAGSELVNTINTYRYGTLAAQSRDLFTTVKRYYSNSFTDAEKQHSINLFLGNFIPAEESENLWDLEGDYHLHNNEPRPPEHLLLWYTDLKAGVIDFSNTKWWQIPLDNFEAYCQNKPMSTLQLRDEEQLFYYSFYRPEKLTYFDKVLALSFAVPRYPSAKPTSKYDQPVYVNCILF
jgi:hypothetical protein